MSVLQIKHTNPSLILVDQGFRVVVLVVGGIPGIGAVGLSGALYTLFINNATSINMNRDLMPS